MKKFIVDWLYSDWLRYLDPWAWAWTHLAVVWFSIAD